MKVSILTITYNHEKFIAQALDSFLSQKTTFNYEIVIGNDCSTDNTGKIIESYRLQYPDKIRVINNSANIGIMKNLIQTLSACTGEYIAFCEGDDYWIDNEKLEKQIRFMDANPEYAVCFHRVYELDEGGNLSFPLINISDKNHSFDITELAKYNVIHSPSVMYRGSVLDKLPIWIYESPIGDFILHLLYAEKGKILFIGEVMAVYRKHANGVWSLAQPHKKVKKLKWVVDKMDKYFSYKYHDSFYSKQFLNEYYISVLEYYKSNRNAIKYFSNLVQFFRYRKKLQRTFGNFILLGRQYFNNGNPGISQ